MKPDLVVLPRFHCLAGSSRYRCFQFLPAFREAGLQVLTQPLFSGEYLRFRYAGRGWPAAMMIRDYLERWRFLRSLPPGVPLLIEKELFPWVPAAVELALLRSHPFILDFDDAVHVWYNRMPFLQGKFAALVRRAGGIQAGNSHLAAQCRLRNARTRIFPTVLDPEEYRPRGTRPPGQRLVVGWIGSPLSQLHLESLLPTLEGIRGVDLELRCMGATGRLPTRLPQVHLPWSSKGEKEFCAGLDVGIMPLSDELFSQGKCGFKLLQYMAAGVPTIASHSRANNELLGFGRFGLLASAPDEWAAALRLLAGNPGEWLRLAEMGSQRIRDRYALRGWAPRHVAVAKEFIEEAARNAAESERNSPSWVSAGLRHGAESGPGRPPGRPDLASPGESGYPEQPEAEST